MGDLFPAENHKAVDRNRRNPDADLMHGTVLIGRVRRFRFLRRSDVAQDGDVI